MVKIGLLFAIFILICIYLVLLQKLTDKAKTVNSKTLLGNDSSVPLNAIENGINQKKYNFFVILCEDKKKNNMSVNHEQMTHVTVMLKSAAMLTRRYIRFNIITDSKTIENNIEAMIFKWPEEYRSRLLTIYHKPDFPSGFEHMKYWMAPCSNMRMFLHEIFPDLDAVIYMDTDNIFLKRPEELWEKFDNFNNIQLIAMGPTNLYKRSNRKIPYYPPSGVVTAMMMMNLTRMRRIRQYNLSGPMEGSWSSAMMNIYNSYKKIMRLGDMDMFNIFFNKNQNLLYLLGCWWSFHCRWCKITDNCVPQMVSEKQGVSMLHGASNAFYSNNEMKFKVVFNEFKNHNMGTTMIEFLTSLKQSLSESIQSKSTCDNLENIDDLLSMEMRNYV